LTTDAAVTTNELNPTTTELSSLCHAIAAGEPFPRGGLYNAIRAAVKRDFQALGDQLPPSRKPRKPSLTRLAAKAKKLGVAITLETDGAVTVRADNTTDSAINEWDAELIHGKH
jgi:hypothetical protein